MGRNMIMRALKRSKFLFSSVSEAGYLRNLDDPNCLKTFQLYITRKQKLKNIFL